MKSPYLFLVKPYNGRRYDNILDLDGNDFIISSSQEDHTVSNRYAEVVSTPVNYNGDIKPGDMLIVHHNVFKYYYDMKGKQRSGRSWFKDDMFFIDDQQFFMYSDGDQWICNPKFSFLKPSKQEQIAEVRYIGSDLSDKGVSVGDKVGFISGLEYEFYIDGEKLIRMYNKYITMKL